jgi:hypothetical protein
MKPGWENWRSAKVKATREEWGPWEIAVSYVDLFGDVINQEANRHPEWMGVMLEQGHEVIATRLFTLLTGELVISEQMPRLGDFLATFKIHPSIGQIEASVMRVLTMACARWRAQNAFDILQISQAIRHLR